MLARYTGQLEEMDKVIDAIILQNREKETERLLAGQCKLVITRFPEYSPADCKIGAIHHEPLHLVLLEVYRADRETK